MCWYIVYLIELIGCGCKGKLSTPEREREEEERKREYITLIIRGDEEAEKEKSTEGGNNIIRHVPLCRHPLLNHIVTLAKGLPTPTMEFLSTAVLTGPEQTRVK